MTSIGESFHALSNLARRRHAIRSARCRVLSCVVSRRALYAPAPEAHRTDDRESTCIFTFPELDRQVELAKCVRQRRQLFSAPRAVYRIVAFAPRAETDVRALSTARLLELRGTRSRVPLTVALFPANPETQCQDEDRVPAVRSPRRGCGQQPQQGRLGALASRAG